jgi:hypothetical protein
MVRPLTTVGLSADGHSDDGQAFIVLSAATAEALAEALDPDRRSIDDLRDVIMGFNAEEPGAALFRAGIEGTAVDVEVFQAFLILYLRIWNQGGRDTLLHIVVLPPLVGEEEACERLGVAFEAAGELAALTALGLHVDLAGLSERLDRFARESEAAGRDANAAALWLTAAQLTPNATVGANYGFVAAEAASRAQEPNILAGAAVVRAIRLLRAESAAASDARTPAIVLFDALDAALRHLAACERPDEGVLGQLILASQAVPSVEPLEPMMLAAFGAVRGVEDDQNPIELVRPVWAHSLEKQFEVTARLGIGPLVTVESKLGDLVFRSSELPPRGPSREVDGT